MWEKKGYEHLGIRSQNLRDQASRLEKIEHGSAGKSQEDGNLCCDRERDDLNGRTIDRFLNKNSSQEIKEIKVKILILKR